MLDESEFIESRAKLSPRVVKKAPKVAISEEDKPSDMDIETRLAKATKLHPDKLSICIKKHL